jgi:Na+-transporting methylmalonyl-CoA/oxaloacetate decarboxylase gamma subunit
MDTINLIRFINISPIENLVKGRGLELALIGMSVVFSGLVLLTISLFLMERIMKWHSGRTTPSNGTDGKTSPLTKEDKVMTGEEAAAIFTAIILYHRLHMDEHRQRITFQQSVRPLSPWALSGKSNLPYSK